LAGDVIEETALHVLGVLTENKKNLFLLEEGSPQDTYLHIATVLSRTPRLSLSKPHNVSTEEPKRGSPLP
jgi:hypothetical protein